jgi:hypothetical protein
MKFENITIETVKTFERFYPDVDVVEIITKRAPAWLFSNPERAHKKNWKRFLNNWFSSDQEKYSQFKKRR